MFSSDEPPRDTNSAHPPGLLAALHELLGLEIEVMIYIPGAAFTASSRSRLLRVAEVPPDHEAVTLQFEDLETITLAPEEVLPYCGCSVNRGRPTRWIEVHVQRGPSVLIEEVV
jgi:hypothetical protein